ncbi:ankyrin repeat-containing [Anaeramoeba flamelloides]|uniref:Ankyrin repeat-containing n=1 Tax=Anaeramoeba flamelloides TaxID=1746091 RepID=A0AAV8AEZ8_9EUKA|nr:ankyrin repeat-containing [Anaeramoeba flamelloides]
MNKNNVYELTSKEIVKLRGCSLREVKSRIDFENLKQIIADPFASKQRTMTFLHYFCLYQPTPTILSYLIFLGLDPNTLSSDRHTCLSLYFSRTKYDLSVITLLVQHGGKMDLISNEHNPLLKLLKENNLKMRMINYLLKEGAELDCVDPKTGCTLLHLLCKGKKKKTPYGLLKRLMAKGADVNTKDKSGRSALDYIFSNKTKFDFQILKIFVQNGYDLRNLNPKNSPLITCCKEISVKEDKVCYLLDNGIDVNFQSKENGNTSLHYLTINNTLTEKMFEKMMRSGLQINLENHQGLTAFNYFCQKEKLVLNFELLKQFITNGSDLKKIKITENPLFAYCSQRHLNFEAINLLFNSDLDLKIIQPPRNFSILMMLCNHSDLPLELIGNYLNKDQQTINYQDHHGWTALAHACNVGGNNILPAIKMLIANGADVNVYSKTGYSALEIHAARPSPHFGVVKYLIKSGSKVNNKEHYHTTILQLFSQKEKINYSIIKYLLKHGADVNSMSTTVPHIMCSIASRENPDLEFFQLLISKYKSLVNPVNSLLETPLHLLCRNPHTTDETLKYLIENGANLNAQDKDGKTALHILLYRFQPKRKLTMPILQLLLERGADPNLSDKIKQTPLHYPINRELFIPALALLIKFGADCYLQDMNHRTPLDTLYESTDSKLELLECFIQNSKTLENLNDLLEFICKKTSRDIEPIKLLVSNGAQLQSVSNIHSPLIYRCKSSPLVDSELRYLIENGCNVNAKDCRGTPVMSLLTGRGYLDLSIYKLLIDKGANINSLNLVKQTPFQCYIKNTFTPILKVVDFFVQNGADLNNLDDNGLNVLDNLINTHSRYSNIYHIFFYLVHSGASTNLPKVLYPDSYS